MRCYRRYTRWKVRNLKGWHMCRSYQQAMELEHMREEHETLTRLLESVKRNRANYEGRNRSGVAA